MENTVDLEMEHNFDDVCPFCGEMKERLVHHVLRKHNRITKFCPLCLEVFNNPRKHMRQSHDGDYSDVRSDYDLTKMMLVKYGHELGEMLNL